MTLKRLVIALILDLALFFNLERLSFGEDYYHFINLQGFVYVVGVAAIIATLLLPPLRRWNVGVAIALTLAVYIAGKLFFFKSPTREPLAGFNLFITITEIALLTLSVIIAHALSRALRDFEHAVENITLNGISRRLRDLHLASEEVQTELARSRRYHTPLSVIVVEPEKDSVEINLNRAVEEVQRTMMTRYVTTSMAAVLTNVLRRTDMVLEQRDRQRFVVLSPETDAQSAQVLVQHIQSIISDRLQVEVQCGVAEFPKDALTFEELIRRAEKNTPPHNGHNGHGETIALPALAEPGLVPDKHIPSEE